nr:alpha/beta hydrolase [uncultured Schaedlerella sp.]
MRRTILVMAFGMSLLFILNACGSVGNKGNTLETVTSKSAEKNTGDQSGRSSGQIAQAGQEVAKTAEYKTKEIHVDKEGMDIYGVVHIPSRTEEKMPVVIMSHELGATLDRVKAMGKRWQKKAM